MKKHIINEQTGISYTLVGDYYLPDFALEIEAASDEPEYEIFGWGLRRKNYLKNYRKVLYSQLLTSGKLNAHLHEIDEAATNRMEQIVRQMAERDSVTEQLKATDQMKWVGLMNNYRHCAEEIVLKEVIYE